VALRHQLIVLQRRVSGRVQLTNGDRFFLVMLYRWFPSVLKAITIIRPETLVRWHRAGFRRYWRWKSHSLGGRPQIDADLRALIRRMSVDNPLWGAPRIHGELLKLGFEVAQYGPIRCPDPWLRPALCLHYRATGPPRSRLDQRHTSSDRGLDRTPDHGGIPLERGPALPHPRSRSGLRRCRQASIASHGHPPVQRIGCITSHALLGGLHHHYMRG